MNLPPRFSLFDEDVRDIIIAEGGQGDVSELNMAILQLSKNVSKLSAIIENKSKYSNNCSNNSTRGKNDIKPKYSSG